MNLFACYFLLLSPSGQTANLNGYTVFEIGQSKKRVNVVYTLFLL